MIGAALLWLHKVAPLGMAYVPMTRSSTPCLIDLTRRMTKTLQVGPCSVNGLCPTWLNSWCAADRRRICSSGRGDRRAGVDQPVASSIRRDTAEPT